MSRPAYQRGRRGGRPGQWVAVADLGWQGGKRDRREFTAPTKREAEARRDAFLHKREAGFLTPKGRALYVSEWLEHWLHNIARQRVEATTWRRSYRQAVEDYMLPFFSRTPLAQLAEEDVQAWHAWLGRRKARGGGRLSAATIRRAHGILSGALKQAVVLQKLPRNPCSNVSPPRPGHAERAWPSAAECARILERCKTWPGGARWALAITTGLRQSEALALCWRDVKLDGPQPSVTVRRARTRVEGEWVTKAPKSAKGRRVVPLPAGTAAALRAHRAGQTVTSLDGLVFTTARGLPVHGSPDRRDFARLLDDLKLPHYRVHDLRHAYGSLLLEAGEDVRVVQELMGHSSASVTQDVYQHVSGGLKMRAASRITEALGGE